MKKYLLLIHFVLPIITQAQIIQVLQPNADAGTDAVVWSLEPIVNYGDFIELRAMDWTWDGEQGTHRSFFQFNLGNIPVNAEICYAYLSLYHNDTTSSQYNSSLSGPNTSVLSRVITPWSENLVTWDTQPSITMTNSVTIPESVLLYEDMLDIDVTAMVADMIADPMNSFGFSLRLETEEFYRRRVFATSDNPDSTRHPKLELCYSLPVSIDQLSAETARVYPNPIRQGDLHVTTNIENGQPRSFAIFNNLGQLLYENTRMTPNTEGAFSIDAGIMNQLTAGNYLLRIFTETDVQTVVFHKAE